MTEQLLPSERVELERLEGIIERGLRTFTDVGQALMAIRDSEPKLYRVVYSTFEEYCKQRWGLSRPYAYQLMDGAQVVMCLSAIADIVPATESQARPLAPFKDDPDTLQSVWVKAIETAPNGKVTAAHVEQTVRQFRMHVLIVGDEQPDPVNEEDDLITTERVAIAAWELADGGTVTPHSISEATGISSNGAWRMLSKISRVLPITEDRGHWFRLPGRQSLPCRL